MNQPSTWPFPRILAHRGAGKLAPENTIAAMRCGLTYGFRAVEFDVMLSGDGVPVLMHDPQFGRTIAGSGSVAAFTAEQLALMDAGAWFDRRFTGEPVPTFHQVLDFCQENGIWMNVEIKPAPGREVETGRAAGTVLREHWAMNRSAGKPAAAGQMPLMSSFAIDALQAAKEAAPEFPCGMLFDKIPHDWQSILEQTGAIALHTNWKNLTKARANAIKQTGYHLFCYTVNDPDVARKLFSWGVDAFCTDRIDMIGPDFS